MKKNRKNEVRQLQKIAGLLKESEDFNLSDNPLARPKLTSVFQKYAPNLLNSLKLRERDPEDIDAHNAVKNSLEAIAKELGVPIIPFMDDVMFSGTYSPSEALNYAKEMFAMELDELGLEEDDQDLDLSDNPLKLTQPVQWTSILNPEINGIEIYNDDDNRLFVVFDKETGKLHVINDWNGQDYDEVWGSDGDIRPDLLRQVKG